MRCQRPGTAWQNAWTRPCGSKSGARVAAKITPDVPSDRATVPSPTAPTPTAFAAWSPPPATTGVPARRPGGGRGGRRDRPGDAGPSKRRRKPRPIELEGVEHLRRPVAGGEVEEERPGAVGLVHRVGRRSGGGGRSPWAAARARCGAHVSGSWSPDPEQLRRREAGDRVVAGDLDEPFRPDARRGSRRTRRRSAGRSTGSPAGGRRAGRSSSTAPCIWPVSPTAATSRARRRRPRPAPAGSRLRPRRPTTAAGSCSLQSGCGI